MTAKRANITCALVLTAILMIGSHVDGQINMCVNLGGEWQGQGICRL